MRTRVFPSCARSRLLSLALRDVPHILAGSSEPRLRSDVPSASLVALSPAWGRGGATTLRFGAWVVGLAHPRHDQWYKCPEVQFCIDSGVNVNAPVNHQALHPCMAPPRERCCAVLYHSCSHCLPVPRSLFYGAVAVRCSLSRRQMLCRSCCCHWRLCSVCGVSVLDISMFARLFVRGNALDVAATVSCVASVVVPVSRDSSDVLSGSSTFLLAPPV